MKKRKQEIAKKKYALKALKRVRRALHELGDNLDYDVIAWAPNGDDSVKFSDIRVSSYSFRHIAKAIEVLALYNITADKTYGIKWDCGNTDFNIEISCVAVNEFWCDLLKNTYKWKQHKAKKKEQNDEA